jgi:phosphate starvation-inducible membrane PsiE
MVILFAILLIYSLTKQTYDFVKRNFFKQKKRSDYEAFEKQLKQILRSHKINNFVDHLD